MPATSLSVKLMAHTQLSKEFVDFLLLSDRPSWRPGQGVALTAIRTCYSPLKPTEILPVEGEKYFGADASDGQGGSDADRLCRHIVSSGHTSTLEHISFTFTVEGLSRAAQTQLVRHRVGFGFSIQSQRYVRFGSGDKSGGFDYLVPEKIKDNPEALAFFEHTMRYLQGAYDELRAMKVTPEDARAILPQAASSNLVMSANLRALLQFYGKRRKGRGAQHEITELAEAIRSAVVKAEPWTERFFEVA